VEIVSFIVLILLSSVGYCAGAVAKGGRFVQLHPQIIDLVLVSLIWVVAIYSTIVLDLSRWLAIPLWIILSSLIGVLAVWPRKLTEEKASSKEELKATSKNILNKLWQSWGNFSMRMGNFQSRIVLSLFFFTVISPFALAVKMFSDPLSIKCRNNTSHWLSKMTCPQW